MISSGFGCGLSFGSVVMSLKKIQRLLAELLDDAFARHLALHRPSTILVRCARLPNA